MIAYAHTSLRVLGSWFCVVVWRVGVRYSSRRRVVVLRCSSRRCVVACVWLRARVPACVRVWVCVGGAARLCAGPPLGGVLWRFPTLPHPLGCSTLGAAGLSFQVRNVAGRFPGAVTTTRLCRPPPLLLARRRCVAGCPCLSPRGSGWWGGGWVGRGSYSGCGCFVPPPFPCCRCLARVRGPGGGGGCLVARPPRCWPLVRCLGLGVPGPPPCGGAETVWGVGAGVGGVGVVSAH